MLKTGNSTQVVDFPHIDGEKFGAGGWKKENQGIDEVMPSIWG
jgi:hypothetical protein